MKPDPPASALPAPTGNWYVSIPLADLDALVSAARRLPELEAELARCYTQLDAVRGIQIQLMDKYKELYKML